MSHTALFTTEKRTESPILIVDRSGIIGEKLVDKIKNESVVVFVSKEKPRLSESVVHIPFSKHFPTIPDNRYSHIIIIDEKLEFHNKTLESFLKKAKKDNALIFFGISKFFVTEKFYLNFVSKQEKVKLGIIGEVFAKDKILDKEGEMNKVLMGIKTEGKINIPGDGTKDLWPVLLEDVVAAVLEICFSDFKEKVFYILPKNKITFLTLAAAFKKIYPEVKLDFIKQVKEKQQKAIVLNGRHVFGEKYDLLEKIKLIDIRKIKESETGVIKKEKKSKNSIFLTSVFFLTLILLPLFFTIAFVNLGNIFIGIAEQKLNAGDAISAKINADNSLQSFFVSKAAINVLKEEASLIGQQEKLTALEKNIYSNYSLGKIYSGFSNFLIKTNYVLQGKSNNPGDSFREGVLGFISSNYDYNQGFNSNNYNVLLNKLSSVFNFTSPVIKLLPDIFAVNSKKNYLILFEDNSQIRPGGGVINYYAILTLENGKINNFKVYDSFVSDTKLKEHIEPPYPIRRFLPTVNWSLRDSNFNVDFSKNAIASSALLNEEEHVVVDGVIAVDNNFIKELLLLGGPIKINNSNQEIKYSNFDDALKKSNPDFIKNIVNGLVAKFSNLNNALTLDLLNLIAKESENKHILFSLNNPIEQAAIGNYSSVLSDERKDSKNTINDFLGISESNLGQNNANLFTTRDISQNISLQEDGGIKEELTVSFKNSAGLSSNKIYKNYIRFILPQDTKIDSITINGVRQEIVGAITDPAIYEKSNFVIPKGIELNKEIQSGKDIYGFLVNIVPQEIKTIVLNYTLAKKNNLSTPEQEYSLRLFKQPGMDNSLYKFSLIYPKGFNAVIAPIDFKSNNNSLSYSAEIFSDTIFNIKIGQK